MGDRKSGSLDNLLSRRRFIKAAGGLAALGFLSSIPGIARASSQSDSSRNVLFLHEGSRRQNDLFADLLRSHWGINAELRHAPSYQRGDIENFDALIYSGEQTVSPPQALTADVERTSDKNIVLINPGNNAGSEGFGYVHYNDANFSLNPTGVIQTALPGGEIRAIAVNQTSGETVPAIVRQGNKTFVLYRPYLLNAVDPTILAGGEEGEPQAILRRDQTVYDDSIPVLNELHDVLGGHERTKKVSLRLEDINPHTYQEVSGLRAVFEYLNVNSIPFHIGLIPRYKNPGQRIDFGLSDNAELLGLLRFQQNKGNEIILHGYTHQNDEEGSISGLGFEFWNAREDRPLRGDSADFARERVRLAKRTLEDRGLTADGWTTPQYTASATDWGVFLDEFEKISRKYKDCALSPGSTLSRNNQQSRQLYDQRFSQRLQRSDVRTKKGGLSNSYNRRVLQLYAGKKTTP